MLTISDMFPEAPTEVHFAMTLPSAACENVNAYGSFQALAISASLIGYRVSVDDFNPDGSSSMVVTGSGTMADALAFGSVAMVNAETFGMTFSPLMVVNI